MDCSHTIFVDGDISSCQFGCLYVSHFFHFCKTTDQHYSVKSTNNNHLYFLISFLPESVRWLVIKGKYAEARIGFETAAKMNKKKIPEDWLVVAAAAVQAHWERYGKSSKRPVC